MYDPASSKREGHGLEREDCTCRVSAGDLYNVLPPAEQVWCRAVLNGFGWRFINVPSS